MDKQPTLEDIKTDLQFEKLVAELKSNNDETYDSSLNIPFWRARNINDFANSFDSASTRFTGRMRLLEKPNDIIDNINDNKAKIADIGKKLIEYVAVYQSNVTKSRVGERLLQGLDKLEIILKNYTRPDSSATLPGPGKR
jgi:uncharacterized phage infection (PIP) family protein YhgE